MGVGMAIRGAWRKFPAPVKFVVRSVPPLNALRRVLSSMTKSDITHDDVYTDAYFERVERLVGSSAEVIAETIASELQPSAVLDVGCGTGALLARLKSRGVETVGLELAEAAIRMCRSRGLDVQQFDLEKDQFAESRHFDVVVSTEVAEHLPESCADRYVDLLCGAASTVVFTAAPPGQGGTDHINEQPSAYWIDKFKARGFRFEEEPSLRWRALWRERETAACFHENLMIFQKSAGIPGGMGLVRNPGGLGS